MRATLSLSKSIRWMIIFQVGWLTLAGCAREAPVSPATATPSSINSPSASSTQEFSTATLPSSSTQTVTAEARASFTPTPNPQPVIGYTPWELVHDIAWSQDGSHLAVSAGDRVHIYDAATQDEVQSLYVGAWAVDLDYQLDDLLVMADKDGFLQFWETDTGKQLCRMNAHNKGANSLDIDPGGRLLASAGNDAILRLWDLAPLSDGSREPFSDGSCNLQLQGEMIGGAFAVPAVRFSPDASLVASIDLQVVRLRDPLTQRLVRSLYAENSLFDIAFSPDGRWLATGELGNQVRLWEVSTGEVVHTLQYNANPSRFTWRVVFSPDGEILAAGSSDGTITLWEANSGNLLQTIPAHARAVTALEFKTDGKWLASGSLDASVRLWEMSEGGK